MTAAFRHDELFKLSAVGVMKLVAGKTHKGICFFPVIIPEFCPKECKKNRKLALWQYGRTLSIQSSAIISPFQRSSIVSIEAALTEHACNSSTSMNPKDLSVLLYRAIHNTRGGQLSKCLEV